MGTERDSQAAGEGRHLTDSLAKIAAELLAIAKTWIAMPQGMTQARQLAARIEALALEPGERETVREAWDELKRFHPGPATSPDCTICRAIAALTPIAERSKP